MRVFVCVSIHTKQLTLLCILACTLAHMQLNFHNSKRVTLSTTKRGKRTSRWNFTFCYAHRPRSFSIKLIIMFLHLHSPRPLFAIFFYFFSLKCQKPHYSIYISGPSKSSRSKSRGGKDAWRRRDMVGRKEMDGGSWATTLRDVGEMKGWGRGWRRENKHTSQLRKSTMNNNTLHNSKVHLEFFGISTSTWIAAVIIIIFWVIGTLHSFTTDGTICFMVLFITIHHKHFFLVVMAVDVTCTGVIIVWVFKGRNFSWFMFRYSNTKIAIWQWLGFAEEASPAKKKKKLCKRAILLCCQIAAIFISKNTLAACWFACFLLCSKV